MKDHDSLAKAKRRLSLPALMKLLGHGEHAKKSARCPFHDDSSASFSVYPGVNGEPRWKCFSGGCGQGDAIDYLARARGLSNANACSEFIRLAGGAGRPAHPHRASIPHHSTVNSQPFDWTTLVAAFTPEHAAKLVEWRGYSPEFVSWLRAQSLIGIHDGERIALPVHDATGAAVACHYRREEDGSWRYEPAGKGTHPMIVGDPRSANTVWVFESQWDAFAVMDRLGWHVNNGIVDTVIVITRGAENGKLITGLCSPTATVYAFAQNDPARADGKPAPAVKWLSEIAGHCGCDCVHVVTPQPNKDANDWTRTGATVDDLRRAIADGKLIVNNAQEIFAPTASRKVSNPITDLPENDAVAEAQEPFPTDCLPPSAALMVRAVAASLRVPEALPGTMALALMSASIGKGLALDWRPGKGPTPGNLFVVTSAESGAGKTECYKLLAAALLAFERAMQDHWRQEVMPQLQADLRCAEGQLKKLDKALARATDSEEIERARGQMKFHIARVEELMTLLHEPQISIQDATVEKLATVMGWNAETSFSTSSDARKLVDNILGRYSANNGPDEAIYLCGWSGDDVKVDRQGREGVRLANPCLALLWALQPDALERLLTEVSLQQGGLLARCLIAHSYAEPQPMNREERAIPDSTRAGWETLVRDLIVTYHQPATLPPPIIESDEPAL